MYKNPLEGLRQMMTNPLSHVGVTIFVTDMEQFSRVVDLRRKYFSAPYPADSIVEVRALYTPEAMIEIEAIAIASDSAD